MSTWYTISTLDRLKLPNKISENGRALPSSVLYLRSITVAVPPYYARRLVLSDHRNVEALYSVLLLLYFPVLGYVVVAIMPQLSSLFQMSIFHQKLRRYAFLHWKGFFN